MGFIEFLMAAILNYISIFLGAIVAIIVQRVILLIKTLISTAWPKKIKTPFGVRYRSSKPIIPPQGGLLYPFIQTAKAMEMIREKRRIMWTTAGLIALSFILLVFKELIRKIELLVYISEFFVYVYNALRFAFAPLFDFITRSLASIGVYLDPIITSFLILLALVGTLIREVIG